MSTNWVQIKRIAFLVLGLLLSTRLGAAHGVGGSISYEYVGGVTGVADQYRISLTLIRDLPGAGFGTSQTVTLTAPGCGITSQVITLQLAQGESSDSVSALYRCVPLSATSIVPRINIFQALVTLAPGCDDIRIYWQQCCRPPSITGLVGPSNQSAFIEAEINRSIPNAYSSSLQFRGLSSVFLCSGRQALIPQGGVDPDGDSVYYELVPARQSFINPLYLQSVYTAPLTYLQPFTTTTGTQLVLDNRTGMLTLNAQGNQSGYVVIRATDYRWVPSRNRWIKMGSSLRELYVAVSTLCTPSVGAPPTALSPSQPGWSAGPLGVPQKTLTCGDTSFTMKTVSSLNCGDVDAQDFRLFSSQGSLVPIKRAKLICTGATGNTIEISVHGPLFGGSYVLQSGMTSLVGAGFWCDGATQLDTIASINVVNCPSPAVIACPGVPNCPPSVSVTGPHTFYSTWSSPATPGIPPHTSTWTLTGGSFTTPFIGDTVSALITDTTATLVLETRFSLCVEYDTLVLASTVDLPEPRALKLVVVPNPTHDWSEVSGIPAGAVLDVVNVLGQTVLRTEAVWDGTAVLDVSKLARGTYWVVATSPYSRIQSPLVKL